MFKHKNTFSDLLKDTKLDNKLEQDLIDTALSELEKGIYEEKVHKNLTQQFSRLSLEQGISEQGLSFFQTLNSGKDINGSAKLFSFFGH